jgi:spore coat polysaccharide biosynthesis protein SpsF (cytidylyltransferase family)
MTRPLVLIQARDGGTRLPGKIHMLIEGRPMLAHVWSRVQATGLANALCRAEDWPEVAEEDVLGRFHAMLTELDPEGDHYDPIIRITADCPLLEGWLVHQALDAYSTGQYAGRALDLCGTGPAWDGLDVEVFSRAALARAHAAAREPSDREHVTRWIRQHGLVDALPDPPLPLRFSVDDEAGLAFVRAVFAACEHCLGGVPHHTNARGSIGGSDRHICWDLHHLERGDLVECLAEPILRTRMGGEVYVSI